jgi:hypothetical protein
MAFLVAPLAVPLLLTAVFFVPGASRTSLDVLVGLVVVIATYAGTFLVGLPAYLFLRKRRWTAFWVAPIVRFAVATATWFGLVTLVPLPYLPRLTQLATLLNALWPIGPIGGITGALLWFIARPDRTGS